MNNKLNFREFDDWVRGKDVASKIKNISINKLDSGYYLYKITLNNNKILECKLGNNVEVYYAWFDKYYSYVSIAYEKQEKEELIYDLKLAINAILDGNYHEILYLNKKRLLMKDIFLDDEKIDINWFKPQKIGLINRLKLFSPNVKKEIVKPDQRM